MPDSAVMDAAPIAILDRNRLLTIDELCAWWRCSRKYIWELRTKRKGDARLPSYKLANGVRFSYDECLWYLKKLAAE